MSACFIKIGLYHLKECSSLRCIEFVAMKNIPINCAEYLIHFFLTINKILYIYLSMVFLDIITTVEILCGKLNANFLFRFFAI